MLSRRTLTSTTTFLRRQMRAGVNSTLMRLRKIGMPTKLNQSQSLFLPTPRVAYFSNFVVHHGRLTTSGTRMRHSFSKVKLRAFRCSFYIDTFSGVCGRLEGEGCIIRESVQHSPNSWCHLEHLASDPGVVQPNQRNCVSVENWIHELRQALLSQNDPNGKIRVSKCARPARACGSQ